MAGLVTVRALEAFDYEGRDIRAGDSLIVSPIQAAVLARQRRISLSLTAPIATPDPPPPEPPQTARRRRQYRRRDLEPEP